MFGRPADGAGKACEVAKPETRPGTMSCWQKAEAIFDHDCVGGYEIKDVVPVCSLEPWSCLILDGG